MAHFTMQLKEVIESVFNPSMDEDDFVQEYEELEFNGVKYGKLPVVPDYEKIGMGTYPIFNENYRKILNGKIIDEYYNQEICTETIDNWLLIMRKKLDQIMPYYNELYETLSITYDPLSTMDIHSVGKTTLEGEDTVNGTTVNDTNTKSGARAVNSNFPQSMLAGNADYASTGADTNSTSEVDSTVEQNSTSNNRSENNSDNRVTGYQGIASELIIRYRNSLINIDLMILEAIEDCFMLVLNSGDEYFARENTYGWGY